ncbi:MAG TPA: hypothetical protein VH210_17385 [Gaiellaceae bacterium]|nr:hypothetical protein [Gaiellaceae bacterium]
MITIRAVENDADIDTYIEIRTRIQTDNPLPREVLVEDQQKPDHLGLIAEPDGEPVATGSVSKFWGARDGEYAALNIRVVKAGADRRGQGGRLEVPAPR